MLQNHQEELFKWRLLGSPSEFLIQQTWIKLRICFSDEFPGDAEAACWGSTLWGTAGLHVGLLQGAYKQSNEQFQKVILVLTSEDVVSVLSKLKPFDAYTLGWKNKAFVSKK